MIIIIKIEDALAERPAEGGGEGGGWKHMNEEFN